MNNMVVRRPTPGHAEDASSFSWIPSLNCMQRASQLSRFAIQMRRARRAGSFSRQCHLQSDPKTAQGLSAKYTKSGNCSTSGSRVADNGSPHGSTRRAYRVRRHRQRTIEERIDRNIHRRDAMTGPHTAPRLERSVWDTASTSSFPSPRDR